MLLVWFFCHLKLKLELNKNGGEIFIAIYQYVLQLYDFFFQLYDFPPHPFLVNVLHFMTCKMRCKNSLHDKWCISCKRRQRPALLLQYYLLRPKEKWLQLALFDALEYCDFCVQCSLSLNAKKLPWSWEVPDLQIAACMTSAFYDW